MFILIYKCRMVATDEEILIKQCTDIHGVSVAHNEAHNITGRLLLFTHQEEAGRVQAVQRLEGKRSAVCSLYNKIKNDTRADKYEVLEQRMGKSAYPKWAMHVDIFPESQSRQHLLTLLLGMFIL